MRRSVLWVAFAVAAIAFVVLVAAPIQALRFLNGVLATAPDYVASADDLDLLPFEGAVAVDGIRFVRPGVADAPPFVEIQRVIVTPHLGALLRGDRIVDVRIEAPRIAYVVGATPAKSQTGLEPAWVEAVLRQYPVTVDHLRVVRGTAEYRDVAASPQVSIPITDLSLEGANLANLTHATEEHFAHVEATAQLLGSALDLAMDLAPYEAAPTFVLRAHARDVPLAGLASALRAYGGFDVQAGTATATIALRAADGRYSGTVEPVLAGVDVVRLSEDRDLRRRPLRLAWEAIVGTAKDLAEIVSPGPQDQVRLPFELEGRFDGPSLVSNLVSVLPKAWFGSLLHAFTSATASAREADRTRAAAVPIAERESAEPRR
jgi:hypothetical protein